MKNNKGRGIILALVMIATAISCSKQADKEPEPASTMPAMAPMAQYTLVLKSNWTPQNHPFEYPTAGALSGPHFSGIIGTSHNESFRLFAEGTPPTPGLEKLSEEGKHSPLDEEINTAIASDAAGAMFTTGPLRNFSESLVVNFTVDSAHPWVSFAAMIAPSPDWFTGARVNLMEMGDWSMGTTLDLYAYDSGGDDGTTYKADNMDNNPKKPTMKATSKHFVVNGAAVPVAKVTITKN